MDNLCDIKYIKELMNEFNINFKKKFGQNFLTSESVLDRISDNTDENVLEIGPGIGSLTSHLTQKASKVVAVEIDSDLIPVLNKTVGNYDNVKIIEGDIMKMDIDELVSNEFDDKNISVCANLPYYITTPVLIKLLSSKTKFSNITIMIQKEVADRICAAPGSSDCGSISLFTAYYGEARKLFKVSASCFVPAPKVDSAVVRIDIYNNPPVDSNPDLLFKVIKAAFEQRRKTLLNALNSGLEYGKDVIQKAIIDAGLNENIRGEKLSLYDFAKITDILEKKDK